MPRGRPRRQPSLRNLQIYHALVCEGRCQHAIATQLHVSQPRVARVVRQVNSWVENVLPTAIAARLPLAPGLSRSAQRFQLAITLRRQQLSAAYEKYLSHFGGPRGAAAYGHVLAAHDAGELPEDLAAQLPPRHLDQSAARYARELNDLDSFAKVVPSLP